MTPPVGQLEQEIRDLESTIESVKGRIEALYAEYAQVIGQAVRKQLILATYHLCTQTYPSGFLALTITDRQGLQSRVVNLSDQAAGQIHQVLTPAPIDKDPDEVDQILGQVLDQIAQKNNELLTSAQIIPASSENSHKIYLRLAEVEFTDRAVMSQRGELRILATRLQQLGQELDKKVQTKLTIEADHAWRSTWIESL